MVGLPYNERICTVRLYGLMVIFGGFRGVLGLDNGCVGAVQEVGEELAFRDRRGASDSRHEMSMVSSCSLARPVMSRITHPVTASVSKMPAGT